MASEFTIARSQRPRLAPRWIRLQRGVVTTIIALGMLSACRSPSGTGTVADQPAPREPAGGTAPTGVTRPHTAIAEGQWRILVQSRATTRELGVSPSPADSSSVALSGRLSVQLPPDSAKLEFSPDSAVTRSSGRVRIPRVTVHRQLPSYRITHAAGRSSGAFMNSIRCSEARGDQLVSGFLPLPLLLPASSLRQEWIDSTHASICIGSLSVTMLIVTRYSARMVDPPASSPALELHRISTLTAVTTATMDSLPVEVHLNGTSTGQVTLPPGAIGGGAVIVTDTVRTELSFRSPYLQQRFEQQAIRTMQLRPEEIRR